MKIRVTYKSRVMWEGPPEKVLEVPTSTALAAVWVAYHTRKKAKRGLWKAEIIKERNEDKGINQK